MNPDLVREQVMNTLESYRNTLADNRRVLFDRRFEVVDIALKVAGATLAAWTGASTKELMARLGHSTPRAALRYQHRDREMPTAWVSCSSRIRASPWSLERGSIRPRDGGPKRARPGRAKSPRSRARTRERVRVIETPFSAWEADVLPLNYTRRRA